MADFGRFWPASDRPKCQPNGPRWRQVGAKMAPRWPSWALDGRLDATWGAIWSIFARLGSDLRKNGRSRKSNDSIAFWLYFGVLGGVVGGSWGRFWAILATSWALLGDLGIKLGTCWQHVGTKMVKDGLRWRT